MLPWKSTPPRPTHADRLRRLPRTSNRDVQTNETSNRWRKLRDKEERYISKMILMMLVISMLPAIMMLLYLVLNPDAFQYDITP